jgi:hypothetical protein
MNVTRTALRIARAYVKLWCIPENSPEASLLIVSIGSCEIRMIRGPEFNFDAVPLFWLELFDRSTKTSVDGFSCHRIRDAVPVFDDFISQACHLNEPDGARR